MILVISQPIGLKFVVARRCKERQGTLPATVEIDAGNQRVPLLVSASGKCCIAIRHR
jgi:hypothetical protein